MDLFRLNQKKIFKNMNLGKYKIFNIIFFFLFMHPVLSADKIDTVPLINLEELSPTFEEEKEVLEKLDKKSDDLNTEKTLEKSNKEKNDKIYINLRALDKITAKTSSIRLAIGEKKYFGSLEIKGLKCQLSENNEFSDAVAYLQVKDLDAKDNNQVVLFNGWTFASSPTLESIDHPIYDLWITGCENI